MKEQEKTFLINDKVEYIYLPENTKVFIEDSFGNLIEYITYYTTYVKIAGNMRLHRK